jgi:hypothetical protein
MLQGRAVIMNGDGQRINHDQKKKPSRQGRLIEMKELLIELWDFFRVRKKYWLTPVIIVLLLLGALLILSSGSAIAPFIYTIF